MALEIMTTVSDNTRSADFKHITPDHKSNEFRGEPTLLNIYVEGDLNANTLEILAKTPNGAYIPVQGVEAITETGLYTIWAASFVGAAQVPSGSGHNVTVTVESQKEAFSRLFGDASNAA